jgi:hypothetical protein
MTAASMLRARSAPYTAGAQTREQMRTVLRARSDTVSDEVCTTYTVCYALLTACRFMLLSCHNLSYPGTAVGRTAPAHRPRTTLAARGLPPSYTEQHCAGGDDRDLISRLGFGGTTATAPNVVWIQAIRRKPLSPHRAGRCPGAARRTTAPTPAMDRRGEHRGHEPVRAGKAAPGLLPGSLDACRRSTSLRSDASTRGLPTLPHGGCPSRLPSAVLQHCALALSRRAVAPASTGPCHPCGVLSHEPGVYY